MKDWCSVGEKVAVEGMRGILTVHRVTEDDGVWLSDGKNYCRSQLIPCAPAPAVTIKPGDYVAVEDITCEAIHAAVVKCFEAAGGVKNPIYGNYSDSKLKGNIFLIFDPDDNELVHGGKGEYAKRRLTLQQLFTATNSIRWPDWAHRVELYHNAVFFRGAGKFEAIVGNLALEFEEPPVTLATRSTVSDAELRPTPELGWYDWSADRARELPPVGEVVGYMGLMWDDCIVVAYDGTLAILKNNCTYLAARIHEMRPANYSKRKADLERDRIIAAAIDVLKATGKWAEPNDECHELLIALYEAGMLREPRS